MFDLGVLNLDKLNIAIVAHGRFHMFDLAKELILLGHNVTLISNYPRFIFKKYQIPSRCVVSWPFHLFLIKILEKLKVSSIFESFLHSIFGRWACSTLKKNEPREGWHAILIMSGVALESFSCFKKSSSVCMLIRSSTHIVEQYNILKSLSFKSGQAVSLPSDWMIQRELLEYDLSDVINVPSNFSLNGFLDQGVDNKKMAVIPLGVNFQSFKVGIEQHLQRIERIKSGKKIRILNTGLFSLRKGALVYKHILDNLNFDFFDVRHVGAITGDAYNVYLECKDKIDFTGKVPQESLVDHYLWADLFIIFSVEDGFAVVVSQAMAMGLPVVATSSVGSADLLLNGISGFIVPPDSPQNILEILNHLNDNRDKFVEITNFVFANHINRSWKDVAIDTVNDLIFRVANKNLPFQN